MIFRYCATANLQEAEKNIAYKAAEAFFDYTKLKSPGIEITIDKTIPISAGMAGGSADGAAVIVALNKITGANLSDDEMCKIGLKVGADLPFCITGGTKLAQGIGEELSGLSPIPNCNIVVAKPDIGVSTAKAYELIDSAKNLKKPNTDKVISCLENGDLNGICSNLGNVFEEALALEEVKSIRKIMTDCNALGSIMSGSGSAVYAVFSDENSAKECYSTLKKYCNAVYMCRPAKNGVVIL